MVPLTPENRTSKAVLEDVMSEVTFAKVFKLQQH